MIRLALFDCDGTLADSAANIVTAMRRTFAAHGLPAPPEPAVRAIVGLSLVPAMAALAPDANAVALAGGYKAAFRALRDTPDFADEPLFPGILGALDTLAADGWTLGVATGKSDRGLRLLLEAHGIADRFATLQTADRHASKPDPAMAHAALAAVGAAPHACVVIGDTRYDVAMARAAGCAAVGVAWGYHPPADLAAAGADAVVTDAADLPATLRSLVPA